MPNILTDADKAKIEQLPTLYSVTGDIKDANTLLVPRSILRALPAQVEQEAELVAAQCNPHPDAPHGFVRNASHSEGRYVCECEGWEPPESAAPAAPAGMAVPDLSARLAEAHDASLDDDHRACRAILTECIAALAASQPAGMAVPEGYTLVAVKGLDELVRALNRAESKGYMPDAMADEWAAFDYQEVAASPSAQAAPARGAMTEEEAEAGAQADAGGTDVNWSDPANLFITAPQRAAFRRGIRHAERFHGIGTTAPAGREG